MFEFTDPSLQGEVNSNMNLGVLDLKLHVVHFADKFSEAKLVRLRRKRNLNFNLLNLNSHSLAQLGTLWPPSWGIAT